VQTNQPGGGAVADVGAAGRRADHPATPQTADDAPAAAPDWLQRDLSGAVSAGQLTLRYQPMVELATGRFVGFEALARWDHPDQGPIPPARFIPVAEHTGLIIPIGSWVLAQACRQVARWNQQAVSPLMVSVNVSARQLAAPDLPRTVARVLAATRLPADRLTLEITESAPVSADDDTLTRLRRLKDLGIQLAIDDFGTGYSTPATLRRLPIDILKIDKLFVDDLPHDADAVAVVATIVRLASHLRLTTVAEGIEAAEQRRSLQQMGCDLAQSYLLGKPLTTEDAHRLLRVSRYRPLNGRPLS
jgi:EAL domain-containing protein (putative c-di-GMP-specific phosphodiesterase class I)